MTETNQRKNTTQGDVFSLVTLLGENWNSFLEDLERLDAAIEEIVIDET